LTCKGKNTISGIFLMILIQDMGYRQRAEGREQRAEGRGQRAEGRGQRAEGREQRAESRGQRAEGKEQRVTHINTMLYAPCPIPYALCI
jgi:hypothetical protein